MASIKKLDERRYKITVSNGYRPNGKKISKAKTIQVPSGVPKRGIGQHHISGLCQGLAVPPEQIRAQHIGLLPSPT